eukprot:scaffold53_cov193-Pinguiococcus_pyrenoidosus.AAC.40
MRLRTFWFHLLWALPGTLCLRSARPASRTSRASLRRFAQKDESDDIEAFRRRLVESQESDVQAFREKLLAGAMEFDRVTKAQSTPAADEWVAPAEAPQAGRLLIANPELFFSDPTFGNKFGAPGTMAQFFSPDQLADLLPVVLLFADNPLQSAGYVLNRRTGKLMGDLAEAEDQEMRCFQVQPIWWGGPGAQGQLSMLHTYPQVEGAKKITDELYLGGSFDSAQDEVTNGIASSWNFKFFLQVTLWGAGSLEDEIRRNWWLPATCSHQVVMKVRERGVGALRAKPMWKEVLELAGGEYDLIQKKVRSQWATLNRRRFANSQAYKWFPLRLFWRRSSTGRHSDRFCLVVPPCWKCELDRKCPRPRGSA